MKKCFKLAVSASLCVFGLTFNSYGQDTTEVIVKDSSSQDSATAIVAQAVDTASSLGVTDSDYTNLFFSIAGLVLLVQLVTGWVLKFVPSVNATIKQLLSWIVSCGLAYFGMQNGYGLFAGASLTETLAYGIGVAMVANHLYDAGTLDNILKLAFAKSKK